MAFQLKPNKKETENVLNTVHSNISFTDNSDNPLEYI